MKPLPADIPETIYFRGILPSAMYGIGIWGSCSPSLLQELEKVHRRAACIIHKIPKQVPRGLILDEAKVETNKLSLQKENSMSNTSGLLLETSRHHERFSSETFP